jgi:predicted  nucleic acid-binding Zn-ribbon protein
MQVICAKCQHVNDAATGKPMETCPQCGVIYARAALAQSQQRQAEAVRNRVRAAAPEGNAPGFVERIGWYLCLTGAVVAGIELSYTFAKAESAPQQAAGAAISLALAAIPYCLARALQMLMRQ